MDDNGGDVRFASRLGGDKTVEGEPAADADELVAPGDIYATVTGQRLAVAIEFIGKDDRSFTVPYSYLPLLWWHPPGLLTIEYPGLFSVLLHGKELDELHRLVKDHRIAWVHNCPANRFGICLKTL